MTKRFEVQDGDSTEESLHWVEPIQQALALQAAARNVAQGNMAAGLCFTIMWSVSLALAFALGRRVEETALVVFLPLGLGVLCLWVAVFLLAVPRSELTELWGGNRAWPPSSDRAQIRRALARLRIACGFGGTGALLAAAGVLVASWT